MSAAACMPLRRCWPEPVARCAASTGRSTAMTADPLDALRLPVVPVEPRPTFAADLLSRIQHAGSPARDSATVRYFVDDLDAAVDFYRQLGFDVELRPSPVFAMLYRGDLRLLLSIPSSHTLADGTVPGPGGWNRISLRVEH